MKTLTAIYSSPLGPIVIESDGLAITGLRFSEAETTAISTTQGEVTPNETAATIAIIAETFQWLDDYFAGKRPCDMPRLTPKGTAFQQRVWRALLTVPYGKTVSYGEITKMVDCRSAQAVGQAVGANPIALLIPCHRVVTANGQLGGYAYGTEIKKRLLELEQL